MAAWTGAAAVAALAACAPRREEARASRPPGSARGVHAAEAPGSSTEAASMDPAGERPVAPPDVADRVKKLVADLGSDRFQAREAASRALVDIGALAVPVLTEALRHPDSEVRARAGHVLEQIGLPTEGLTPEAKQILVRLRDIKVTLEFQDQPLSEVIDFLRDFTKLNFIVDADVNAEDLKVTLKVQNLPLQSALNLILGNHDLVYVIDEGCVHILPMEQARRFNLKRQRVMVVAADPNAAAAVAKLKSAKVDLDFQDAGLQDIVDFIRSSSNLTMVIDPGVTADAAVMDKKITFKVRDLPLDRTLRLLLDQYGLDYTFREKCVYITRPEEGR